MSGSGVPGAERGQPRFRLTRRAPGGPNRLRDARLASLAEAEEWASARVAALGEDAFFAAGIALYAGEGAKRDGTVKFANTDPDLVAFFLRWLRRFFDVDEARLRVCVYLHDDLDYDSAVAFWSGLTGVPASQFTKPYRAQAGPRRGTARHRQGCAYVSYHCSRTHREVMALCRALVSCYRANPA